MEKLLSRLNKSMIRLLLFLNTILPLCLNILNTIARQTMEANLPGSHANPQFLGNIVTSVSEVTLNTRKLADVIDGAAGVRIPILLKNGIPRIITHIHRKKSIKQSFVIIFSDMDIIAIPTEPIIRHENME